MNPASIPPAWSPKTGQPETTGTPVTLEHIDALVADTVEFAADQGLIPIAAAVSTPRADGRHLLHGVGWNRLAEGVPGIHGETGALRNAGLLPYRDAVVTTSLAPCPFCQATMTHLGIREVRILDATNYAPDVAEPGLQATVAEHPRCVARFGAWRQDPARQVLWARDIGLFDGLTPAPPAWSAGSIERATRAAARAALACPHPDDAPIGAVILDGAGEVIGTGCTRIHVDRDPTAVAAMVAWRRCGGRAHWRDCSLVLTDGPDRIAASMFTLFGFGQLLVSRDDPFSGELANLVEAGVAVTVVDRDQEQPPTALARWLPQAAEQAATAALGPTRP